MLGGNENLHPVLLGSKTSDGGGQCRASDLRAVDDLNPRIPETFPDLALNQVVMGDNQDIFAMKNVHDLHEEIHSGLQSFIRLLGSIRPIPIFAEHELLFGLDCLKDLGTLSLVADVSTPSAFNEEIRHLWLVTGNGVQKDLRGLQTACERRRKHLVPMMYFMGQSIGKLLDFHSASRGQGSIAMSWVSIS